MMGRTLTHCLLLGASLCVFPVAGLSAAGQAADWNVTHIADSLKQGALSVVRCDEQTFTQTSETTGRCQHHRVVTILTDQGDNHALWATYTDSYTQLNAFECRIYDASGKEIKKVKEKELGRSEYSSHLMSDGCHYYYVPGKQSSYPYTIEFQWEEKLKNGIDSYINHQPVGETRQSAETCRYQIVSPLGEVRALALNTTAHWQRTEDAGQVRYSITLPPFCCIQEEDMLPSLSHLLPMVSASRLSFSRNGYAGQLDTWEHLGDWAQQLWEGRQELPANELDSVAALTAGLDSEYDKIKVLYQYVGRRTRYVSIQLGIGGWQPMPAAEVSHAGFGDCKALTNYLHSLLSQVGIVSYPVIIGTRHDRYRLDYPNFYQNNHCILCVPQANDSLWLDCTAAAVLPCGIIARSLRGHDCLLLRPEGTQLARVPNPIPQWITSAHITIDADLQAHCEATEVDYKDDSKSLKKQYGKVLGGSTQLFPIDPYIHITSPKFRKGSVYPMYLSHDVSYIDTLHFSLADGVTLASVPDLTDATTLNQRLPLNDEPLRWSGQGLSYDWAVEISRESQGIRVIAQLHRHAGTLPALQKETFVEQCRRMDDIFKAKLMFKKL